MKEPLFNEDDRQYLEMMQENITRMANNSANCKTWFITLCAAFLTASFVVKPLDGWGLLAVVPAVVLWCLDAYYLGIERGMRNRERLFINIVKKGVKDANDIEYREALFCFQRFICKKADDETGLVSTTDCFWSDSVWPVYLVGSLFVVAVFFVQLAF